MTQESQSKQPIKFSPRERNSAEDDPILKEQSGHPSHGLRSERLINPVAEPTEPTSLQKRHGFLNALLTDLPSVNKQKPPFANPNPPEHKDRVEKLEDFTNFHKHEPMIEQDPREENPIIDMNEVFAAKIMEELRKEEKFKTLGT